MIRTSLCTAALAFVLPVSSVLAGGIPPEGKIDVTWIYSYAPVTMPTGGGEDFNISDVSIGIVGNVPGSLLDHMAGRCMMAGPSNSKTGAYKLSGRCTYTDADGDMIFAEDEEVGPSATETAKGSAKFLGGTGKYAGITGGYEFTDDYFGQLKAGTYAGGGRKTGTYKIVK
ncbi:MAG: hypothetical protein U1E45_12640 [Geminicoccaceae bacterium]